MKDINDALCNYVFNIHVYVYTPSGRGGEHLKREVSTINHCALIDKIAYGQLTVPYKANGCPVLPAPTER